jgi:hypothetical protein
MMEITVDGRGFEVDCTHKMPLAGWAAIHGVGHTRAEADSVACRQASAFAVLVFAFFALVLVIFAGHHGGHLAMCHKVK